MKTKKPVEELLIEQKEKLKTLEEKREALDLQIKKTKQNILTLEHTINKKKTDELTNLISSKGLSLDDVIKAVSEGNLSELQNKLSENL